jgi:hypothetical protein
VLDIRPGPPPDFLRRIRDPASHRLFPAAEAEFSRSYPLWCHAPAFRLLIAHRLTLPMVQTEFAYVCRLERRGGGHLSAGQPGLFRRERDSGRRNEQGHGSNMAGNLWEDICGGTRWTRSKPVKLLLIMQSSVGIGTCLQKRVLDTK